MDTEKQKFMATLRVTFGAETPVDAHLVGFEITEAVGNMLEDGDTVDVTQIIPLTLAHENISPEEMVSQLHRTIDLLIKTKIIQCFEQAKELHKTAWILEHRREEHFDLSGYDYGAFYDRMEELIGKPGERRAHD